MYRATSDAQQFISPLSSLPAGRFLERNKTWTESKISAKWENMFFSISLLLQRASFILFFFFSRCYFTVPLLRATWFFFFFNPRKIFVIKFFFNNSVLLSTRWKVLWSQFSSNEKKVYRDGRPSIQFRGTGGRFFSRAQQGLEDFGPINQPENPITRARAPQSIRSWFR